MFPLTRRTHLRLPAVLLAAAGLALAGCSSSDSGGDASQSEAPAVSADQALADQVPDAIKSDGKLTYGSDTSYAPGEFIDVDGTTIIGFEIDLANAVAQKLGLQGGPRAEIPVISARGAAFPPPYSPRSRNGSTMIELRHDGILRCELRL